MSDIYLTGQWCSRWHNNLRILEIPQEGIHSQRGRVRCYRGFTGGALLILKTLQLTGSQDEVEELKSLVEQLQKVQPATSTEASTSELHSSIGAASGSKQEQDIGPSSSLRLPSDSSALQVLRANPGDLVRRRASEVRHGERSADL